MATSAASQAHTSTHGPLWGLSFSKVFEEYSRVVGSDVITASRGEGFVRYRGHAVRFQSFSFSSDPDSSYSVYFVDDEYVVFYRIPGSKRFDMTELQRARLFCVICSLASGIPLPILVDELADVPSLPVSEQSPHSVVSRQ